MKHPVVNEAVEVAFRPVHCGIHDFEPGQRDDDRLIRSRLTGSDAIAAAGIAAALIIAQSV